MNLASSYAQPMTLEMKPQRREEHRGGHYKTHLLCALRVSAVKTALLACPAYEP